MLTTIVATIVVLGVLIFVHELGHFLVARRAGVTVLRFSLGFGPRLWGIQRGETEYCLSLIPLGGYVKMLGEDREEEVPEDQKPFSFSHQPVSKRLAIVLAGPLSNVVLALALFTFVYAIAGMPYLTTEIGSVNPNSPAARAGLKAGDKVIQINGRDLSEWDELSTIIQKEGQKPIDVIVDRGGQLFRYRVTPQVREVRNIFGEKVRRPIIGITASGKLGIRHVNPLLAGYYSLVQTWHLSKLFFMTVVKLIERVLPMQTLGGPLLIAQMAGQQAQQGVMSLLHFMALISVNLAILNLLPIPVLDGGHIFFFLLEAVLGRPVSMRKLEIAQKIGLAILILLMILVVYNDIMRMVPGMGKKMVP